MSADARPRGARLRAALGNLALAVLATLVALLGAELALRVVERLRPPPVRAPVDPRDAALPELRSLFELTQPNVAGRIQGTVWRTNSHGFLGPDVSPERAPGSFRIAVLGDSFVAGMGVAEADAYPRRLEAMLAAAGTPMRFEVLNFGVPGLAARHVVDRGEEIAARFHPSLYVYGYTLNDLFEHGEDLARAQLDPKQLGNFLSDIQKVRSRVMLELLRGAVAVRQAYFRPSPYAAFVVRSYRDPAMLARVKQAFDRLAALAARDGVCGHVLIHADLAFLRFGHPFVEAYGAIESAAREAGLSVSSSWPAFRWRDSTRLRVGLVDAHPNAEAHAILAGVLYDGLRALPRECGLPALPERGTGG